MAQHWIVASTFTKKTLVENGLDPHRVAVVPYGLDVHRYSNRERSRPDNLPLKLLFVGTFTQRKGIKYLLDALELLPPGSVELTICGRPVDGVESFRQLSKSVRICPSISAQDLLQAYHDADVFVFPSLAEGFAQVLLEAMASGLPIISTTNTAAPDLIEHGREGFIVQPGCAMALAQHIENFLKEPALLSRMSVAARQRAEEFTWQRFRSRVIDFIQTLDRRTIQ